MEITLSITKDEAILIRDALDILNPDDEKAQGMKLDLLFEIDLALLDFPEIEVKP